MKRANRKLSEAEQREMDIREHEEEIYYSPKYNDDFYEYRHVTVPKAIRRLLAEMEWRGLGIKQSPGWVHYMIHNPEPHILLFRREKDFQIKYPNATINPALGGTVKHGGMALRPVPHVFDRRHEIPKPAGKAPANLAALSKGPTPSTAIPTTIERTSIVTTLLGGLSKTTAQTFLEKLASFPERYYKSDNGVAACEWVVTQINALAAKTAPGVSLTVSKFQHSWNKQPSVIARLAPTNLVASDIVITGTHIDTIAYGSNRPEPNNNPAADDCASGSTVIFEALRLLVEGQFVPYRPIEFHWYSGEEEGIYGSNEVAESYAKAKTDVVAYLNLDQSGYVKPGTTPTIGIFTDFVDSTTTTFLKSVVSSVTSTRQATSRCGYRCTDNSAWYDHGYRAALPFEGTVSTAFPYNDKVNSDGSFLDTIDVINYDHLVDFIRIAVGFVVELSLAGQP
nr:Leucine aminopeptidase 1 [Polyrhizophydium stewartii]